MTTVTTDMTWLQLLLKNFGVPTTTPTPLSSDSNDAINIS
jgi:hypothetical protein